MDTPEHARLLEQRHGVSFLECLEQCLHSPLLEEWEQLSGKRLVPGGVLDRMIDEATGYDKMIMSKFADFCYEYVFQHF